MLHDSLPEQIAAVWHVLNEPGFTPPEAGAVRIVRTRNMPEVSEPPVVLTDVLKLEGRPLARPFIVGLANRHTVLFDLEQNRLAAWWLGDAARERTEGKRWFWEAGGNATALDERGTSELKLIRR